jgi:hypothetical protein
MSKGDGIFAAGLFGSVAWLCVAQRYEALIGVLVLAIILAAMADK